MTHTPSPPDSSLLPTPAFRLALCFAAGILIGAESHVPVPVWGLGCISFWILSAAAMRKTVRSGIALSVFAALLSLSCGALRFVIDSPDCPALPEPPYARKALLTGSVVTPPEERGTRTTFTLLSDSLCAGTGWIPLRIRVSVTVRRARGDRGICAVSYGMNLLLRGLISAPPSERNPGEFSLRAYDESRGIAGVVSVEGFSGVVIRDSSGGTWIMREWICPLRASILRRVGEILPGREAGFLKDLLLGERSGISGETRESFIDAGVAHVLAVSGYRVLIVAGMVMASLNLLRVPPRIRPFIAAPALLFYMVIALGHPPVVRATVMALVFMLGRAVQRRTNSRNALGVAALIVLGADSRQIFDSGFQLSFGAVLAIQCFMPPLHAMISRAGAGGDVNRSLAWMLRSISLSVIVSLGTLPVTAACFGRVSIVGVLTNIVVVPATGAGMILGTLSLATGQFIPFLGAAYAALDGLLLRWTIQFSGFAASLPFASVETGHFGLSGAIAWYAGMVLATRWRQRRWAARSLAVLLAALNVIVFQSPGQSSAQGRGTLRVSMIDVGQGDAILVEFPGGETLLVDAGPATIAGNAGSKIVVPFLKRRGIRGIDVLVITHPDADHSGGAAPVIRSFPVRRIVESVAGGENAVVGSYHAAALARGSPLSPVWRGESIRAACRARVYVLWPPRGRTASAAPSHRGGSNNASIVFKLVYGGVSFLFTGDAERESEIGMVRSFGGFLRSTVLKIAHHGSNSGTSQEFLECVRPAFALVSVGLHNRFGHPSPALLGRLHAAGARVLRTDMEGALVLTTDGRSVRELSWRSGIP